MFGTTFSFLGDVYVYILLFLCTTVYVVDCYDWLTCLPAHILPNTDADV